MTKGLGRWRPFAHAKTRSLCVNPGWTAGCAVTDQIGTPRLTNQRDIGAYQLPD